MEEVYTRWKDTLRPKQKKRVYKHLDRALDLDDARDFEHVVSTLKKIRTHQFLPLVKFTKKDTRYRRDRDGNKTRVRKERPIMYASHLDTHIYSFYAYQWSKEYEKFLDEANIGVNVTAYRSRNSGHEMASTSRRDNISFAHEIFSDIVTKGDCVVITADISKFFDTLNHRILEGSVAKILGRNLSDDEHKVLRSLTAFRYIENDSRQRKKFGLYSKFVSEVSKKTRRERFSLIRAVYDVGRNGTIKENKTPKGIPQGSTLSGLLANIYMATFDYNFVRKFPDVLYRRYSDDIAIVCPVRDSDDIFSFLCNTIKEHALDINPTKAFVTTFRRLADGSVVCSDVKTGRGEILGRKYVDYLGFEFAGTDIRMRGKTIQNANRKAHKRIKKFLERQTFKNPRKKHTGLIKRVRGSTYISKASEAMKDIGGGIYSQKRTFIRRIRKEREAS